MANTRCKFYVTSVRHHETNRETGLPNSITIYLNAVFSQDVNNENNRFWKATPNGQMEFTISAYGGVDIAHALETFKPGKKFYIDLTEVTDEQSLTG